ncbi:MAG: hypothetical protein ABI412_07800 [Sphingomicrobium sp.]
MIASAALLAAAVPPPAEIAYRIDPAHRIVEGIASDGQDLWVSSILDRAILRCAATCETAFALPGPAHPLGLAWDPSRQWLWIAMHCLDLKGISPCEGELRAVDRQGRTRYSGRPADGFKPGDVSVHRGVVTVSDSANGAVYRLYRQRFSTVLPVGLGKSAQGSATLPNGRTLVVSDYSRGISTFPVPYGPQTVTRLSKGKTIQGIDGLQMVGNRLFGVYNGRSPGKLLEFAIHGSNVSYGDVADGGLLPDPTQVTFHRGALYVVGDSGWLTIDKQADRSTGATIVRLALPKTVD